MWKTLSCRNTSSQAATVTRAGMTTVMFFRQTEKIAHRWPPPPAPICVNLRTERRSSSAFRRVSSAGLSLSRPPSGFARPAPVVSIRLRLLDRRSLARLSWRVRAPSPSPYGNISTGSMHRISTALRLGSGQGSMHRTPNLPHSLSFPTKVSGILRSLTSPNPPPRYRPLKVFLRHLCRPAQNDITPCNVIPVRQDKPGWSCELKGVHHVNFPSHM